MAIKVACPGCGMVLSAPDDRAGKTGKCPTCGRHIAIPQTQFGTGTSSDHQFKLDESHCQPILAEIVQKPEQRQTTPKVTMPFSSSSHVSMKPSSGGNEPAKRQPITSKSSPISKETTGATLLTLVALMAFRVLLKDGKKNGLVLPDFVRVFLIGMLAIYVGVLLILGFIWVYRKISLMSKQADGSTLLRPVSAKPNNPSTCGPAFGKWWLMFHGKATGPFSMDVLLDGLRTGDFTTEMLACHDEDQAWKPLSEWSVLASQSPAHFYGSQTNRP